MAPPAAGPLIQGSTTPMAKETATAASTASPPASSTLAPTSAARRWAAATTPPRVGITALRTIWEREKLSMALFEMLLIEVSRLADELAADSICSLSQRKSGLPDFRHSFSAELGQARVRWERA